MGEAAQDIIDGIVDASGEWSESVFWKDHQESSRIKKESNARWSLNFLKEKGIQLKICNEAIQHYQYRDYDFYPSTGLFRNRKTQKKGRGVKNFLRIILKEYVPNH